MYNKGYKVDYLISKWMEVITKKTVSIEFDGKKYVLQSDDILEDFLAELGLPKDRPVKLRVQKDGFLLLA